MLAPTFFVPGKPRARAEAYYQWLVTYVNAVLLDCQVDPIRIYSLYYQDEGVPSRATVGEIDQRTGQLVIAILRADTYLICTPYYGVQRGEPISVSFADAEAVHYFAGLGNAFESLNLAVKALDGDTAQRSGLQRAAYTVGELGLIDFTPALIPDFMSLRHKLTWRGDRSQTLAHMTDAEAESAAAAIRTLHVHVSAEWARVRGGL